MEADRQAAERAIADFLRALGHDPSGDAELERTPARVVEAFETELLSGYRANVAELIAEGSALAPDDLDDLVIVEDISVATLCPHHLMPGIGTALVAYVPGVRLLGLGTIARIVDACARRLILQEQIGLDVVQALERHAGTRGAYCELTVLHTCLSARGAHRERARVTTISAAGILDQGPRRDELHAALARRSRAKAGE